MAPNREIRGIGSKLDLCRSTCLAGGPALQQGYPDLAMFSPLLRWRLILDLSFSLLGRTDLFKIHVLGVMITGMGFLSRAFLLHG